MINWKRFGRKFSYAVELLPRHLAGVTDVGLYDRRYEIRMPKKFLEVSQTSGKSHIGVA
jgi:hypothetical protein